MTAILGGGLAGLSAAYYALQNSKLSSIVLIEASNRFGGWIKSERSPAGLIFEQGPRTVRCSGDVGKNTLLLIDRLHLSDQIIPININHPASYNRMIYVKNTMVTLPKTITSIFKTTPPFTKSLFRVLLAEMYKNSVKLDDESIHSFVTRRFGEELADYLVSALIAGIFAGDAKQLSMKAFSTSIFEAEQSYGSVSIGLVMKRLRESKKPPEKSNITVDVLMSNSIKRAAQEHWSMWSLNGGLELLTRTLSQNIKKMGVDTRLNSPCKSLKFTNDGVEVVTNGKSEYFKQIISSLPAFQLVELVETQHPKLAEELRGIPTVDVGVVNLEFKGRVINKMGFGFLVAPIENRPILGVIFDSVIDLSIEDYTTLTVMMGGAWYDKYFKNATKEDLLSVALSELKDILKIDAKPVAHRVSILKKCIPQYLVGHCNRLNRLEQYITSNKLPLFLCGSSYKGVGINEVILSGKVAAENIENSDKHA